MRKRKGQIWNSTKWVKLFYIVGQVQMGFVKEEQNLGVQTGWQDLYR